MKVRVCFVQAVLPTFSLNQCQVQQYRMHADYVERRILWQLLSLSRIDNTARAVAVLSTVICEVGMIRS